MQISEKFTDFSRRSAVKLALGAVLLPVFPGFARAMTTARATELIQVVADEVMAIVNAGGPEAEVLLQFEQIFVKYADVPIIARSVLGVAWRNASTAQQQAFTVAFRGYLARKYGRQFNEYKGARIEVVRATDQGQKGILVNSMVYDPGQQPFSVDWQASDRSGADKMFNIYIEGISMLSAERSEVQALLEQKRGNVNALIEELKRRG